MSSKPEPAIWSRDTGQRISWYDSCQLHIICMSNINDICCNPRLHDLVLAGWPPCCATSFVVVVVVVVVGHTRPWSMPLAILTIRKELHGFLFLCIRVVPFSIIMGLRLAALRAAGAPLKSNSEKSSGSLNCFSFLTGLGIKANSTKCKSAMLICLTAFSSDYPPISDLIHLARCVKFNPQFNPWIVLIGLRGTEFNRRINLLRGFGRFNLGLALIGFRTTGAWTQFISNLFISVSKAWIPLH